jgi:hypothetical protein
VAIEVMTWVWKNSKSKNTARLVLLAIADCARADGSHAFPSNPELREKANASERAVQDAIRALVELGELEVKYNGGPRGVNLYRVIMGRAVAAPRRNRTPAESAGGRNRRSSKRATPQILHPPADSAPPQNSTATPAESAPGTVIGTVSTTEVLRTSVADTDPDGALFAAPATPKARQKPQTRRTPEEQERFAVADSLTRAWYEALPIKPSGEEQKVFLGVRTVIQGLLKVGNQPNAIAEAAKRCDRMISRNAMEYQLVRLERENARTPVRTGPWRNPEDPSDYYGDI